jgi:hypothetical protein
VKTNAQASAQKWATNLGAAVTAYTNGVNAVTVPPGQKAAAAQATYIARVTEKAPIWAANVAAVPLGTWQQAAITKGAPRLASGASAAQPKFTTFLTALMQFESNGLGQLPPRSPSGNNDARMIQWSNYMKTFKKPTGS